MRSLTERFPRLLGKLAFRYLLLAVFLGSVELCVVLSVFDFQVFARRELLGALFRSVLIYFALLTAFGAGLLGLGTGVRRFSALRGFPGQIAVILFACFFLVFNFYAQQYLFPGQPVFAPLPIATLVRDGGSERYHSGSETYFIIRGVVGKRQ